MVVVTEYQYNRPWLRYHSPKFAISCCGGIFMRFFRCGRVFIFTLALALALPSAGQDFNPALPLIHVDNGPNSEAARKAHYLVLVSLDGFRWDYAKRDGATHLLALG